MRSLILLLSLILASPVVAQVVDTGTNPSLSFQVVQTQFAFDNTTIKSATIVMRKDNTYEGLLIDLKPEVIEAFKRVSKEAIGKTVNMVLNKKLIVATTVVQSELGASLVITGISETDAQQFLKSLRDNAGHPAIL